MTKYYRLGIADNYRLAISRKFYRKLVLPSHVLLSGSSLKCIGQPQVLWRPCLAKQRWLQSPLLVEHLFHPKGKRQLSRLGSAFMGRGVMEMSTRLIVVFWVSVITIITSCIIIMFIIIIAIPSPLHQPINQFIYVITWDMVALIIRDRGSRIKRMHHHLHASSSSSLKSSPSSCSSCIIITIRTIFMDY